ncbi:MAG: DUF4270 family protein [Saprospiraceae bacterium]
MKTIYYFTLGLCCLALFSRCNEPQELGASFFPDESFDLEIVDTLSLTASSVIYDSIPTRNTGRLLVGYHEDVKLGKISASAYFQLGFADNKSYYLDETHAFYDSITLVLKYDGYSYYDTSQLQTLYIHEVLEEIAIPDDDTTLFNTTILSFDQVPLAERIFYARPGRRGNLEIRLSDRLGKAIFDLATNNSESLSNAEKFQEYLKGLVIIPDQKQSGAILGFSPTAELQLYYRNDESLPVQQQTLVFPMGNGIYYNQISSARKHSVLADLQAFDHPISSLQTNNEAFIQSGIGITTRIDIPYLKDMIQVNNDFLISKAVLEFYPTDYYNNKNTPLPASLTAYWVDEDNQSVGSTFTALLRTDHEFDRDTYYEMDITNFIKTQLLITKNNKNALLLTPSNNFQNSLSHLSIGDSNHRNKMRLKVYLISI